MFYNDVLNIARDIPFVKPCAGKKDAVSFRHCVPGICSFAMRYLCAVYYTHLSPAYKSQPTGSMVIMVVGEMALDREMGSWQLFIQW